MKILFTIKLSNQKRYILLFASCFNQSYLNASSVKMTTSQLMHMSFKGGLECSFFLLSTFTQICHLSAVNLHWMTQNTPFCVILLKLQIKLLCTEHQWLLLLLSLFCQVWLKSKHQRITINFHYRKEHHLFCSVSYFVPDRVIQVFGE